MTITIPEAAEGRLLRSYLKLTLGLSTAALAKLKNHPEGIMVNGARVTVRYVLKAGDVLTLSEGDTPDAATETVLPAELPLDVLYEDNAKNIAVISIHFLGMDCSPPLSDDMNGSFSH